MSHKLSVAQLLGLSESHLVAMPCGNRMQSEAADAFARLQEDACNAGYQLKVASAFRSFERQAALWNGKVSGERPIHDDTGLPIHIEDLTQHDLLHAILRFSALPGMSRHHWGTDVDVYDMGAVEPGYKVQLTAEEVASGGIFDSFHCWLDERMIADSSHGFFRPYARDMGGVAVERWHLSYAPVSVACAGQLTASVIRQCWDNCASEVKLHQELQENLSSIMRRYLAVEENWCPKRYRRAPRST